MRVSWTRRVLSPEDGPGRTNRLQVPNTDAASVYSPNRTSLVSHRFTSIIYNLRFRPGRRKLDGVPVDRRPGLYVTCHPSTRKAWLLSPPSGAGTYLLVSALPGRLLVFRASEIAKTFHCGSAGSAEDCHNRDDNAAKRFRSQCTCCTFHQITARGEEFAGARITRDL